MLIFHQNLPLLRCNDGHMMPALEPGEKNTTHEIEDFEENYEYISETVI